MTAAPFPETSTDLDTRIASAYRDYINAKQDGHEDIAAQKYREWRDLESERKAA